MSLIDKSGQYIGDGSNAIQVAGNATFGNTTDEVIAICELVVKSQMASFRQDAYEIADLRAREFGNQIATKLSQEVDEKLREKLSDPDLQYSINQAVTQVARKGFDAKSELLKELLVSKIENDEEEENLLIDQAIDITSRLTTSEVKFLSLIYYFRNCYKILDGVNVTELAATNADHPDTPELINEKLKSYHDMIYKSYDYDFLGILGEIDSLKKINKTYLSVKGVISEGLRYSKGYPELLSSRTGKELTENGDNFNEEYPEIKKILDAFGIDSIIGFNDFVLNPVGEIISANYLRAHNFL